MPITYAAVFPRFSAHGTFRAKRLKRRVEERVRRDGCIRKTVEMGEKKWSKVLDMGEQRKLLLLEKSFSIIIYLRNLILLPFTTELTFFKRVKINTSAIQTTGLRRK